MRFAAGSVEYNTIGTSSVSRCGVSWISEELDIALADSVAPALFDHEGTAD